MNEHPTNGESLREVSTRLDDAIAELAAPVGRARLHLGDHESSDAMGRAFKELREAQKQLQDLVISSS